VLTVAVFDHAFEHVNEFGARMLELRQVPPRPPS
jgi:hypothetical protein